jgi:hypothetical protein
VKPARNAAGRAKSSRVACADDAKDRWAIDLVFGPAVGLPHDFTFGIQGIVFGVGERQADA